MLRAALAAIAMLATLAGCDAGGTPTFAGDRAPASRAALPELRPVSGTDERLGEIAGTGRDPAAARNPYAGDPAATEQGKALFRRMNCAGCHGYDATGGMGPGLTDDYWRYGGHEQELYQSIASGRPQGMPAWGRALQPEQIWQIVTYLESIHGQQPSGAGAPARHGNAESSAHAGAEAQG